jgi:hypothetical protein
MSPALLPWRVFALGTGIFVHLGALVHLAVAGPERLKPQCAGFACKSLIPHVHVREDSAADLQALVTANAAFRP